MSAIAGGLGIGAGVGLSSVALAPFNAANTFMGSAFFGYGMILGERYMYQSDWPKIQARLENGEKIENIIQEYTGTFTAVVMKEAKIIFDTVTREFIAIMQKALSDALSGTTSPTSILEPEPTAAPTTIEQPTTIIQPAPLPITTSLTTLQIRKEYERLFAILKSMVDSLIQFKQQSPNVEPMKDPSFLQVWPIYVNSLHTYTAFVTKYALQIKSGGYLKTTPYTKNWL